MTTTQRPAPYVIGPGTIYRTSSLYRPRPVPMGCYAIVRDDCAGPPISADGANLYRSAYDADCNARYFASGAD